MPIKLKERTLWDFLNIHSFEKIQKIEAGPFGGTKNFEKVEQSRKKTKGRTL